MMVVVKKIVTLPNGWEVEMRVGSSVELLIVVYDKEGYLISEMKVPYKEGGC